MKHELLAPAGSIEILKAVILAGADAVYIGGSKYGARAYARNFSDQEVLESLDFAHLRGKKVFLTVNTLLKNRETGRELYEYLKPYYIHGLDAIIVQDYGVFQFVRKYFPQLPVHASTQMSVSGAYGASFLKEMGASRIVTARELSLEEIRHIYDETDIEIESFIHGALCYCYSGQCLMSSMLGGRSGNRGRCAQPCRLSYQVIDGNQKVYRKKENYPLSPRDLCTLDLLESMCRAGIYSFKIEGRMKSLEYAAGVTGVYREYLTYFEENGTGRDIPREDYEYLLALGNRNGFTRGYYEMKNGRSMMTLTESSHSSIQARDVFRGVSSEKIPVSGSVEVFSGRPIRLTLHGKNRDAFCEQETAQSDGVLCEEALSQTTDTVCEGACAEEANNRPLSGTDIRDRISKTGDTPFYFRSLDVRTDGTSFVPVKQLNQLRRDAFDRYTACILQSYQRDLPLEEYREAQIPKQESCEVPDHDNSRCPDGKPKLCVFVSTPEQLDIALKDDNTDQITLDLDPQLFPEDTFFEKLDHFRSIIQSEGRKAAFAFPYVFRMESSAQYETESFYRKIIQFDQVYVRSYDSLGFVLQIPGIREEQIRLDHNLYVYSGLTWQAFRDADLSQYTASLELNAKELRHMPNRHAEFLLYGYIPLMISAQCVYKNYMKCLKGQPDSTALFLKDRYFKQFLIKRNCKDCYNVIYNSQPLFLFHHSREIGKLGFGTYRIAFTSEKPSAVRRVLDSYSQAFVLQNRIDPPKEKDAFTNGHFHRGVE